MKRFIKFAFSVWIFIHALNISAMPNCCTYMFQSRVSVAKLTDIYVLIGGVTTQVEVNGVAVAPDYSGMAAELESALQAAMIPGDIGNVTFSDDGSGQIRVVITGVNFTGNNNASSTDMYSGVQFDNGLIRLPTYNIPLPEEATHCTECPPENEQQGTIIRCETCLNITFDDCPTEIYFETHLSSLATYYAWLTDMFNHKIVKLVSNSGGISTITFDTQDLAHINKHSGNWELEFSTSDAYCSKETIVNDGSSYDCVVLQFQEQE